MCRASHPRRVLGTMFLRGNPAYCTSPKAARPSLQRQIRRMHDDSHWARKVSIGPRPLGVLCGIYQSPIRGALLAESQSTVLGSTWDRSMVERLFSLRLVRFWSTKPPVSCLRTLSRSLGLLFNHSIALYTRVYNISSEC
eukprot:9192276-Pyramimonas_sp.AAC.1